MRSSIHSVGFILTPGYALMSLASAVEPLRAARHLAGKDLYRCHYYSVEGGFIASTSGGGFQTDPLSRATNDRLDLAFVVAGGNPLLYHDAALIRGLRALDHLRIPLGGISGGAAILAKAGLMAGRRFCVHWAHIDPLREIDPDLLIEPDLYVVDRDRYTCAGGVAAMDMMGALIARDHGAAFAREVSNWFIHHRLRTANEPQQEGVRQRFNLNHPMLEAAVELMASHLADPLSPEHIAGLTGVSSRQLQRLFQAQFNMPMMGFYRDLRLAKADELLQQTDLAILDIASITGFTSAAHFSRCFVQRYKIPPRRKRHAARGIPSSSGEAG
ncbi:GlxA family transcriptional regulator [Pseudorhizobium endolithicum]|uniref:GlxA family transcriptional regulator n=2 Tax=Pseudorhizobium endolithicum TaxID=1191678 RepID=A0ABN7JNT3_9HYPH|nr:GlxA family transcriptional regulator [Pseudorhizobium endolithicum]